jgi:hypothetical protein
MLRGTVSVFWIAALTMILAALAAMGCGGVDAGTIGEGFVDAEVAADAADAQQPDTGVDAGADTGADTSVPTAFNITGAASTGRLAVTVTFDAPPDPVKAAVLGNYDIPGLTLSGTPGLSGSTVTLVTSAQAAQSYTLTVSNVTRASDGAALTAKSTTFGGIGSFSVSSAVAPSAKVLKVTFDGPPNAAQAAVAGNYTVPGLTLSAPVLAGNVVTLTTTAQAAQSYTVTVAGVTRASDSQPLTKATADFTGRTSFNVTLAESPSSAKLTVTFSAPPKAAQATTLANYNVPGLALSGTPVLTGNTVTITTASQLAQSYTVTVSNVTRSSDDEALDVKTASFTGTLFGTFNLSSAASTGRTSMTVTYDAPPNAAQAVVLANYDVPGLTLSGVPVLAGNVVTLVTTAQAAQSYTVTVAGVTRASDAEALTTKTRTFTGRGPFDVTGAAAPSAKVLKVTFDAAPNIAQATNAANYTVPGLTLSAPVLVGNVVTLTTTDQAAQSYTVTVANVTRASDAEPLTVKTASFTGHASFNVTSASSVNTLKMTVTFDAAPDAVKATTLANYKVNGGLVLSGVPTLVGNTVTIDTGVQSAQTYTVTVSNVTRASDGEALDDKTATFDGTAVLAPTVTNVVVASTSPNNGSKPYNTGTATVTITGTDFLTVACPAGVKLDDLDGIGGAVSTVATSCTVSSATQITATFPAGIRTKGSTGWNVRVTNATGTNATSTVRFVPLAGLLVSEVYTGTDGALDHEFIEIYNPTGTAIDTAAIGLKLHIRDAAGADTAAVVTLVSTGIVPKHGFLLLASSVSDAGDGWYPNRDYTYPAALVGDGGVYISLSSTANLKILDKVGWGLQSAHPGGFEGAAADDVPKDKSIERLPAGVLGHATDTDVNSNDFSAPGAPTPRGIADGPLPP